MDLMEATHNRPSVHVYTAALSWNHRMVARLTPGRL